MPRVPRVSMVHVKFDPQATCTVNGTLCDNYSKQANYLWINKVMKYCVIIYQSLVKTWPERQVRQKRLSTERVKIDLFTRRYVQTERISTRVNSNVSPFASLSLKK